MNDELEVTTVRSNTQTETQANILILGETESSACRKSDEVSWQSSEFEGRKEEAERTNRSPLAMPLRRQPLDLSL